MRRDPGKPSCEKGSKVSVTSRRWRLASSIGEVSFLSTGPLCFAIELGWALLLAIRSLVGCFLERVLVLAKFLSASFLICRWIGGRHGRVSAAPAGVDANV